MAKVGGYASKGGNRFMDGSYLPSDKGLAPKGDNCFLVALQLVYCPNYAYFLTVEFHLYHSSPDFFQISINDCFLPFLAQV